MEKNNKQLNDELYSCTRKELENIAGDKLALSERQLSLFYSRYIRKRDVNSTCGELNISKATYHIELRKILKMVGRLYMLELREREKEVKND